MCVYCALSLTAALFVRALGREETLVPGMKGSEQDAALVNGDADAQVSSYSSVRQFIESGKMRPIAQIGAPEGDPLAGLPAIDDIIAEKYGRPVGDFIRATAELIRLFAGPPGIPEDRLDALRDAVMAATADPELVETAARMERPIDAMRGDELADRLNAVFERKDEIGPVLRQKAADSLQSRQVHSPLTT